jgi:hypothetical protein
VVLVGATGCGKTTQVPQFLGRVRLSLSLPGRFHLQFHDKNRCDIGKSQSKWNRVQDGNASLTAEAVAPCTSAVHWPSSSASSAPSLQP